MRSISLATVSALALLAGCQEQRTVVLEQSSSANLASTMAPGGGVYRPAPRPAAVPSPCNAPIGTGPYESLPRPTISRPVYKPERVMAEKRPSCVGVRFRIAPDGVSQDIVVMAEYPAGYGMAAFGERAVSAMRWPAKDDLAWRYLVINLRPDRNGDPNS